MTQGPMPKIFDSGANILDYRSSISNARATAWMMGPLKTVAAKGEELFRTSHGSREATATGLRASARTVEASGTVETRQQWAPATRNAVELVQKFDEILIALGNDDSFPLDQTIYARLLEQQEKLPQYRLPAPDHGWEGDERTKALILLSAYASKAAYGTLSPQDPSYHTQLSLTTVSEKIFEPSFDGSVKQVAVRLLAPQGGGESDGLQEQILLVAIRGTASFADWMVNLNGDPVDTLFLADDAQQGNSTCKVHSGLLRVAEKMEPQVTKLIRENPDYDAQTSAERGGQPQHRIVLTGHSAGGGIAALLFMHYVAKKVFAGSKISCVTFAAPPLVSSGGCDGALPASSDFVSVINEGDPVPRADKPYIFSFAELYGCVEEGDNAPSSWGLPAAELHIPNQSTILALRVEGEDEDGLQVEVNQVSSAEVEKTVALDFERHRMDWYIEEFEAWGKAH